MISKVFKAYDVRAIYPDPLNEDIGWKIGYATAEFFKQQHGGDLSGKKFLMSRDHRPAAPAMQDAFMNGVRAAGVDVVDLGRCDTSFMYFAIPYISEAIGGAQCTASHNPIEYIGFKISGEQARPIGAGSGLKEIQAIAEKLEGDCPPAVGGYEERDLWKPYREHVLKFLTPLNRKIRIFIDASNGMATKLVPEVFEGVPNLEIIKENFAFTDKWVHEPNPLVAENMVPTQEGVKKHGADLGACFDGDADRCMLVDDRGEIIGCDHLTAWLSDHFLKEQPGSAIVYDLRSSKVVEEQVKALGGKPTMSKVGHVNMKAVLRETDGIFGGELSGHFYFKNNNFADSGAITLAAVLAVMGQNPRPLSEQVDHFRKYPQSGELNFEVADKQGVMDGLKREYAQGGDVLELDGVSIDHWQSKGWWFNVRASNTEPLLRLNAEAKDQPTLDKLLAEITPKLGTPAHGH